MTSQGSSQEMRLKLRIHARSEDSRLNPEAEEIRSPPELLVPQDLDLADGTIVVISQARENANPSDSSEDRCRNELVLKATVRSQIIYLLLYPLLLMRLYYNRYVHLLYSIIVILEIHEQEHS